MQQASYLEGGPLMWMFPLYLHVYQKFDDDDDDDDDEHQNFIARQPKFNWTSLLFTNGSA